MDVHGGFFLFDGLAAGGFVKADKSPVIAAGCQEPLAAFMKADLFDETFELVVFQGVQSLARFPVEDFNPRRSAEMVDVADLADAAGRQQFAVG